MPRLRNLSLRARFFALLLPVLLAAPVALGVVSHRLLGARFDEEIQSNLSIRLLSGFAPLSAALGALQQEIQFAAFHLAETEASGYSGPESLHGTPDVVPPQGMGGLTDIEPAHWYLIAGRILESHPDVLEVFLTETSPGRSLLLCTDRQRMWWEEYAQGEGPAWAWPLGTDASGGFPAPLNLARAAVEGYVPEPVLWMSVPVDETGERFLGVVLTPRLFHDRLESIRLRDAGYALLATAEGQVIYPAEGGFRFGQNVRDAQARCADHIAEGLLSSSDAVLECTHDDDPQVVAVHRDARMGLIAALVVPRSALTGDLTLFRRALLGLILFTTLLAVGVILRLLGWIVDPLQQLSSTMKEVARGNLDLQLPVHGGDEVANLASAFNAMTADLKSKSVVLESQRLRLSEALRELESLDRMKDNFLALVSHEVRTPLTSILSGVEFLRDMLAGKRTEEEKTLIGIIYESGQRLTGFMNDAILMASLQASQGVRHFDEISLTAMVQTQLEALRPTMRGMDLTVENRLEGVGELVGWGDWTLLELALQKVLHNACRHNRKGGRVCVEVVDRILEDELQSLDQLQARKGLGLPRQDMQWRALRIFNTGPIIPPGKLHALFEKFELVHDVAHHTQGSGLSLPIVLFVMRCHGGSVETRAVGEEGMAFYLVLPMRQSERPRLVEPDVPDDVDSVVAAATRFQPLDTGESSPHPVGSTQ